MHCVLLTCLFWRSLSSFMSLFCLTRPEDRERVIPPLAPRPLPVASEEMAPTDLDPVIMANSNESEVEGRKRGMRGKGVVDDEWGQMASKKNLFSMKDIFNWFLVACTRLYKSLCRSVRRSVGPSVRPPFTFFSFSCALSSVWALLPLPNSTRLVLSCIRTCFLKRTRLAVEEHRTHMRDWWYTYGEVKLMRVYSLRQFAYLTP